MKKILNKTLKFLLPLILGFSILYWVYKGFDFSKVVNVIFNEMEMGWLVLSAFFGIMSHVIRGWRWQLTLAPLGYFPSRSDCVNAIFISYAANLVLPRVGEVSRCVLLDKYDKVPFAQSLGTVVAERLIDTLMVLLVLSLALVSQWKMFSSFFAITTMGNNIDQGLTSLEKLGIVILSIAAIIVLLYFFLRKLSLWVKLKSFILRFWEGMASLSKMKNFPLFVIETVGIWFCYFMQFYLCFFCFSFSESLSLPMALALFVAGSVAVVVPTPNGAGPWHFAIISMMMLYGLSRDDASVFALIVHTTQTVLVALLGVVGLFLIQRKRNIINL